MVLLVFKFLSSSSSSCCCGVVGVRLAASPSFLTFHSFCYHNSHGGEGSLLRRFSTINTTPSLNNKNKNYYSSSSLTSSLTSTSSSNSNYYDIVIAGGGIVGSALACSILGSGKGRFGKNKKIAILNGCFSKSKITIKENNISNSNSNVFDIGNRVVALSETSVNLLKECGAWDKVPKNQVTKVSKMIVWDGNGTGRPVNFIKKELQPTKLNNNDDGTLEHNNNNALSYIVKAGLVQNALFSTIIENNSRITSIDDDFVMAKIENNNQLCISTSGGEGSSLLTSLLVGADGWMSKVRKSAGISVNGHSYNEGAIVAKLEFDPKKRGKNNITLDNLKEEEDFINTTAFQRFLPTGPIALLPLSESNETGAEFFSLVWTLPLAVAQRIMNKLVTDPQTLVQLVNAAFRLTPEELAPLLHPVNEVEVDYIDWRLGLYNKNLLNELKEKINYDDNEIISLPNIIKTVSGSIASFPLQVRHAKTYIGDRLVIVGDSAHVVHPLAGQGLNMGLGDVKVLKNTIEDAAIIGQDFGSFEVLKCYENNRYPRNTATLFACDAIRSIFAAKNSLIVKLRSIGLATFEKNSPLKKAAMLLANEKKLF